MLIRFRAWAEYIRGNLFFVPALLLLVSVALAEGSLWLDQAITASPGSVPSALASTVDSARALLSTVAGATITFAGIAVSISLLLIQLAASQFSPRVLYGFFRDSFTKWALGFVVGTFAYCLMVLRVVRQPAETGAAPVIPHVSVLVAMVLGIGSILAIVGLINHTARSMQVGEIIRRITEEAREQIRRLTRQADGESGARTGPRPEPDGASLVVEAEIDGWVQQIDAERLLSLAPPQGVVRLEFAIGGFIAERTPLATIWPPPENPEHVVEAVRDAIRLGRSRTMQQDIGFGFRQLVDIGLRALSPGINDPTTAQEVIVHLGALLRELLASDLPPRDRSGDEGRRLVRDHELAHREYVELAFDQIRLAGRDQPAVSILLVQTVGMLVTELRRIGRHDRIDSLLPQIRAILRSAEEIDVPPADAERIRDAVWDLQLDL